MTNFSLMKKIIFCLAICLVSILQSAAQITANDVFNSIIKETGSNPVPNTVDVVKDGDPQTKVTGIVTTMFATMDVLKKAVELKCNMIISHEPLYYNHLDNTESLKNDPVFQQKQKFIHDNNLVVWRFHDYIHRIKPDGILQGMVAKLGWQKFMVNGNYSQFTIPETTLEGLLKELKKTFPKNSFYVVGNKDMKVRNIRLAPGAPGSAMHIRLLEDENVEVVVAGEAQQWETYEYTRDAVSQGRKKAVIFLGHVSSEEAGMEWCASWLKGFIKGIPVNFVESGPSYWSY